MDAVQNPRYLVFGLGAVGAEAVGSLLRDGADIVGAFTRSSHVGEDLAEVLGMPPCGVSVQSSAEFRAVPGMADIALFFTTTALTDLLGPAKECLDNGINVLTIAEDAMYPWDFDPATAAELDAAAIAGNATLVGTGVNEVAMAQVPAMLAGIVPGVNRIEVECAGDFGAFGAELLSFLQIGVNPADFQPETGGGQDVISRQCARMIAGVIGTEVVSEDISIEPTVAASPLNVAALGREFPAGVVSGLLERTGVATASGVEIEVRLIGKVFEPGDEEYVLVTAHAPALSAPISLRINPLPGVACTAGIALSRVWDVLEAPAGYLRAEKLPNLRFRAPLAFQAVAGL